MNVWGWMIVVGVAGLACPQKHVPEALAESPVTGIEGRSRHFSPWWETVTFPGLSDVEDRIFHYTNEARRQHAKPPLAWNETLRAASRQHSQEMLEKSYFAHESPVAANRSPMQRAYLAGFFGLAGENILSWTRHETPAADAVAEEMVKDWMNSPGHRANILRDSYNQIGVGVVKVGVNWMATQLFGEATFVFSGVSLSPRPDGGWLLKGQAQLVPGQRFSHAAIAVDGEMGPGFTIPGDRAFDFQVPLPAGRHKVGVRPGDGRSFWLHDHFLIDGGFQPLDFD